MIKIKIGLLLLLAAAVAGCGARSPLDGAEQLGLIGAGAGGGAGAPTAGSAGALQAGSGGSAGVPERPHADLDAPRLRVPENGRATGSVWSERALRPRFAWQPSARATSYDLEVDDSCPQVDFDGCPFPSPEWVATDLEQPELTLAQSLRVSTSAPVGRRYFWRARACDALGCSDWSSARYLDVGRQANDLNGDGYADVILTAPGGVGLRGRVAVRFGPSLDSQVVLADTTLAADANDYFGADAIAVGDIDADGFPDLLVSAQGNFAELRGHAFVFFGAPDFGNGALANAWRLSDPSTNGFGGLAAAAGDVDADGRTDLVLGPAVPNPSHPPGSLYLGSARSTPPGPLALGTSAGDALGVDATAGDISGDGYSDLLVVEDMPASVESAEIRSWSGAAMSATSSLGSWQDSSYPTRTPYAVADVNGDGFADIVRCVQPGDAVTGGRVDVSLGSPSPGLEPSFSWAGDLTESAGLSGEYPKLGRATSAGDVNGDGLADTCVDVSWDNSNLLQVNLYLGGLGARARPDAAYRVHGGDLLFVSIARARAVGDVNGDGFDDLVVNQPLPHTGYLFWGSAELDLTPDAALSLD